MTDSTVSQTTDSTVSQLAYQERNNKDNTKEMDAQEIFDYYISKNIIQHKKFDSDMKRDVKKAIDKFGKEEVKTAIENYSHIYKSNDYWFTQKYTLMNIVRPKDIRQFGSEADPFNNFAKDGVKPKVEKPKQEEKPKSEEDSLLEELEEIKEALRLPKDYYKNRNQLDVYEYLVKEKDRLEQQLRTN